MKEGFAGAKVSRFCDFSKKKRRENKTKMNLIQPAGVFRALRVFLAVTRLTVYRQPKIGDRIFGVEVGLDFLDGLKNNIGQCLRI